MIRKGGILILFLLLFLAVPLHAEVIDTGWISGQMMTQGGDPMTGGMIVFFNAETGPPPSPDRYLRIPDEIGEIIGEGKFHILLPVGKYYMGAIKRVSRERIGPPQDGDFFYISQDREGNPVAYGIEKNQSLSVGIVSEAVPFKRTVPAGISGISGTILDIGGNPVEGAIVFAYYTETMTGLPPFTSYRTKKDGKYLISMDRGGKYYLRVRDIYGGGAPVVGAIMGSYGESKPAAVTVKQDSVTPGIDMTVVRHLQTGPKGPGVMSEEEIAKQREELYKKYKEQMKD